MVVWGRVIGLPVCAVNFCTQSTGVLSLATIAAFFPAGQLFASKRRDEERKNYCAPSTHDKRCNLKVDATIQKL